MEAVSGMGKGYCFEGESPSMKRLDNYHFGVFSLICLLFTVDYSSSFFLSFRLIPKEL